MKTIAVLIFLTIFGCLSATAGGIGVVLDPMTPSAGTPIPVGAIRAELMSFDIFTTGSAWVIRSLIFSATGVAADQLTNTALFAGGILLAQTPSLGAFYLGDFTIPVGAGQRFDLKADIPSTMSGGLITPELVGITATDLGTGRNFQFVTGVAGNELVLAGKANTSQTPEPSALLLALGGLLGIGVGRFRKRK